MCDWLRPTKVGLGSTDKGVDRNWVGFDQIWILVRTIWEWVRPIRRARPNVGRVPRKAVKELGWKECCTASRASTTVLRACSDLGRCCAFSEQRLGLSPKRRASGAGDARAGAKARPRASPDAAPQRRASVARAEPRSAAQTMPGRAQQRLRVSVCWAESLASAREFFSHERAPGE